MTWPAERVLGCFCAKKTPTGKNRERIKAWNGDLVVVFPRSKKKKKKKIYLSWCMIFLLLDYYFPIFYGMKGIVNVTTKCEDENRWHRISLFRRQRWKIECLQAWLRGSSLIIPAICEGMIVSSATRSLKTLTFCWIIDYSISSDLSYYGTRFKPKEQNVLKVTGNKQQRQMRHDQRIDTHTQTHTR